MTIALLRNVALIALTAAWAACTNPENSTEDGATSAEKVSGISPEEAVSGIGPIDKVALSATIDTALVSQGEEIFTTKCGACHKMNERYVGPPLGDVLERRTPEFVMNMMLNPDEMAKKHPDAQELLAEYLTPMPNQNLSEEDARAVLEFLRSNEVDASEGTP